MDWSTIIVDSESTSQVNGNWWGLMVSMTFCESNMASWEISEVNGASNCRKIIELNDMNILKPTRRWIFSIPTRNSSPYMVFSHHETHPHPGRNTLFGIFLGIPKLRYSKWINWDIIETSLRYSMNKKGTCSPYSLNEYWELLRQQSWKSRREGQKQRLGPSWCFINKSAG